MISETRSVGHAHGEPGPPSGYIGTVEESIGLDMCDLHRQGVLAAWDPEHGVSGEAYWTRQDERHRIAFRLEPDSSGSPSRLILRHEVNGESVNCVVPVTWTRPNYGGRRHWFRCRCGRRARIVYRYGSNFVCRHCARLTYRSTRESDYERLQRRARKVAGRLGPDMTRPPRMRWWTYFRLLRRAKKCEAALNALSWEKVPTHRSAFRY